MVLVKSTGWNQSSPCCPPHILTAFLNKEPRERSKLGIGILLFPHSITSQKPLDFAPINPSYRLEYMQTHLINYLSQNRGEKGGLSSLTHSLLSHLSQKALAGACANARNGFNVWMSVPVGCCLLILGAARIAAEAVSVLCGVINLLQYLGTIESNKINLYSLIYDYPRVNPEGKWWHLYNRCHIFL